MLNCERTQAMETSHLMRRIIQVLPDGDWEHFSAFSSRFLFLLFAGNISLARASYIVIRFAGAKVMNCTMTMPSVFNSIPTRLLTSAMALALGGLSLQAQTINASGQVSG